MIRKRQRLDRGRILQAANDLVDREGLEALSMRKLGAALGVEAMSLYHYFPNKQALLDGIVETVVSEMKLPPSDEGEWEELIREGLRAYRRLAHAHPHVFPLLGRRPVKRAEGLQPVEWTLDVLRRAGFQAEPALHAFRTLSSYAFGYALSEIRGFALEPHPRDESRLDIRTVDPQRFPRMREIAPYVVACDHDAEFELGMNTILSSLRNELDRQVGTQNRQRSDTHNPRHSTAS